jgi:catechol 2,3-dioxygenase-like lactoylglutathione lyase family enzyme
MASTRLDHVACVVGNLDAATRFFHDLFGLEPGRRVEVPGRFRSVFVPWGDVSLELIERAGAGLGPDEVCIEHLAFATDEFDAILARLRDADLATETTDPRVVAGRRAIFFDPATTLGVRLQLVDSAPASA